MTESTDVSSASPPRQVGAAPNLAEVRTVEDDWSGVTRPADRRRRQNRLNQRAYRGFFVPVMMKVLIRMLGRRRQPLSEGLDQLVVSQESASATGTGPNGYLMIEHPQRRGVTYAFMQLAHLQYSLGNYRLTYLPSLIRLNAINALSENAHFIGISLQGICRDDLISPFNALGPKPLNRTPAEQLCPNNMLPTAQQQAIQHHPWTDLLPAPRLRDNVLAAIQSGALDEDELCADLMEVTQKDQEDGPYLIVWGQASDVANWEASTGFIRKWGGLLRGCPELIRSTNAWRLKRGERTLDIPWE